MNAYVERRSSSDRRPQADTDLEALARALRDAERSAAVARDRAAVLSDILDAHAAVAGATGHGEIVETVLRCARTSLGFERAMWLDVEPTRTIVIRACVDGSEIAESAEQVLEYEPWSSIAIVVRQQAAWYEGQAAELGAPIVDVRDRYALVPVRTSDGVVALVYADGSPSRLGSDWQLRHLIALAGIASTAIDRAALLLRLQTLANRDSLTGLYNRRAFNDLFCARIEARSTPFVFAIIDIDDFKSVNDTRGHAVGDAVLKRLARTLQSASRSEDIVGRFAGDEFVVLLDGLSGADADAMVERLCTDVRSAGISCSIGAARYPTDGGDAEALFAAADGALYVAKACGKNRFAFFTRAYAEQPT